MKTKFNDFGKKVKNSGFMLAAFISTILAYFSGVLLA